MSEQLSRRTLIGGKHKYCKAAETCPAGDEQIEIQSGQAIRANNKLEKKLTKLTQVAFKGNWHLKKGKHVDATWMYKRCHAKELSQLRDGRAGNSMLTTATPGLGHAAPAA